MDTKELREKYPEQVAEIEAEARAAVDTTEAANAAVNAERERLSAIDEVADLFDSELVREAKYGNKPCTAAELALLAAQNAKKQGTAFLAAAQEDAKASGTGGVGATPPPENEGSKYDGIEQAKADAKAYNDRKNKEVR